MSMQKKLLNQKDEIVRKYKSGKYTQPMLATEYHVSPVTIYNMLRLWMSPEERLAAQKLFARKISYPVQGRLYKHRDSIISEYRAGGISYRQLAVKHKCTPRMIQTLVASAGMSEEERRAIADRNCYKGTRHWKYRGGRRTTFDGHEEIKVDGKYIGEHRVVAAQVLGRDLTETEVVHHVYGDKKQNDKKHLAVLSCSGIHHELHHWIYRRFGELHPKTMLKLHREFLAAHGELPPLCDL